MNRIAFIALLILAGILLARAQDMRVSSGPPPLPERTRFNGAVTAVFTELRTNRVTLVERVTVTSNLVARLMWYDTNGVPGHLDEVKASSVISVTTNQTPQIP